MTDLCSAQLRRLLTAPWSPENDRAQDAWERQWMPSAKAAAWAVIQESRTA